MNPNMAQSLIWDHIRESRQQAAAARRADAARHSVHTSKHVARRRAHRPENNGYAREQRLDQRTTVREERMMTTQHTSMFSRMARRIVGVFAEIRYAQHRMDEILTSPTGE